MAPQNTPTKQPTPLEYNAYAALYPSAFFLFGSRRYDSTERLLKLWDSVTCYHLTTIPIP